MDTTIVKSKPVIGIVGGMGPQAGNAVCSRITALSTATCDQDHLPVIMVSFPHEIADRSQYLNGFEKENPGYAIARIIATLETAGATLIGIACNTAHAPAIFDVIQMELHARHSRVNLLHMPGETCRFLREQYPGLKRVGVLATNGTSQSGLYSAMLEEQGFIVVSPPAAFQDQVIHRMIYDPVWGIKACPDHISTEVRRLQQDILHFFSAAGTEALILGCTELSLVFDEQQASPMHLIDATDCLARALINLATTSPTSSDPVSFSPLNRIASDKPVMAKSI
jgi:aspartate racemase